MEKAPACSFPVVDKWPQRGLTNYQSSLGTQTEPLKLRTVFFTVKRYKYMFVVNKSLAWIVFVPLVGKFFVSEDEIANLSDLIEGQKALRPREWAVVLAENTLLYFAVGALVGYLHYYEVAAISIFTGTLLEFAVIRLFGNRSNIIGWRELASLPILSFAKNFFMMIYQSLCFFILGVILFALVI